MGADDLLDAYGKLRELAFEDPLETKGIICALLTEDLTKAKSIFTTSRDERGSRFRQIAARSLKAETLDDELRAILETWSQLETDEFALTAIQDILNARSSKSSARHGQVKTPPLLEIKETYFHVSSRLRHRVLNALPASAISVEQIRLDFEEHVSADRRLDFCQTLDALYGRLMRLKNVVAFDEELDRYFEQGPIPIIPWLQYYKNRFTRMYDASVAFSGEPEAQLHFANATPFWLEIVFSNLWKNSWDEVSPARCDIIIEAVSERRGISLICYDNGGGFPELMTETAFKIYDSTKGEGRGRGLLEIRDAMARMGGSAELVRTSNGLRVKLTFKKVNP